MEQSLAQQGGEEVLVNETPGRNEASHVHQESLFLE